MNALTPLGGVTTWQPLVHSMQRDTWFSSWPRSGGNMNEYTKIVKMVHEGLIKPPNEFNRIYMAHKRKIRTNIDYPKPTPVMIYEHNWHYASRYGQVCPCFYGYSN